MEGDLTWKWHWEEEAYQRVELDGGGSNLEVDWEEEAYQRVELDRGGSNLEVALGGGLPDSGTRWRGI